MISVDREALTGTCGVQVLFDYAIGHTRWHVPISDFHIGGMGYAVAGFINTITCRRAYAEMCERFHLEYQSPVEENENSGNMFFFCVFRNK